MGRVDKAESFVAPNHTQKEAGLAMGRVHIKSQADGPVPRKSSNGSRAFSIGRC